MARVCLVEASDRQRSQWAPEWEDELKSRAQRDGLRVVVMYRWGYDPRDPWPFMEIARKDSETAPPGDPR